MKMPTITDKIVKVEELGDLGEHFSANALLGSEMDDYNVKILHGFQPDESWKVTGIGEEPAADSGVLISINIPELANIDEAAFASEPFELEDVLRRLPDGWPQIAQLQQPHCWDYSTAVSPSVNQAVSRLELLQTAIEEWFKESEQQRSSQASRSTSFPSASSRSIRLHHLPGRFDIPDGDSMSATTEHSTMTNLSPRRQSALCVKGVGALTSTASHLGKPYHHRDLEVPCLGADVVIDDVMSLLATLELDRKETVRKLGLEYERVAWLQRSIDEYLEWRLLNMPKAVHREHGLCMADISELTWHCSYRGRLAARLKKNVDLTEGILAKIQDEINIALCKIPLVQEKLQLEGECVEKIIHTQADVKEELELTAKRSEKMLTKNDDVGDKVATERKMIKTELDSVDESLQKVTHKMEMLNMAHATYSQLTVDYRKKHEKNLQDMKAIEQRETLLNEQNDKEAREILTMKRKLHQMAIHKKHILDEITLCELEMENDYTHLLGDDNDSYVHALGHCSDPFCTKCFLDNHVYMDLLQMKRAQAADEKKLRATIDRMEDNLANLNLTNRDMNMNTEDIYIKINASEKKTAQNEKNYQRMLREMEVIMKESKALAKELEDAKRVHEETAQRMTDEELKTAEVEHKLQVISDELVNQIQEEVQSRNVIEARIHVEQNQMEVVEEELEHKLEKAAKMLAEVNKALALVKEKVRKLQEVTAQKDKVIETLNAELKDAIDRKSEMLKNNEDTVAEIVPVRDQIQEKLQMVTKEMEKLRTKEKMLKTKIAELVDSGKVMDKSCAMSENTISELKEEVTELSVRLETKEASRFSVSSSLDEVSDRIVQLMNCHDDQMKARKGVLQKTQEELLESLSTNSALASEYRSLQNGYLFAKQRTLDVYGERVTREKANKDLKDLHTLQQRMHAEIRASYDRRGAVVMRDRDRMLATARNNSIDTNVLRDTMAAGLKALHTFLEKQEDGEMIRKQAMAKAEQEV